MELSEKLKNDIKANARRRASLNRRISRELRENIAEYHRWYERQYRLKKTTPAILAEGDSWFRYLIGFAVIWHIEAKMDLKILNLADPGDEASEMLSGIQKQRLMLELKRGPVKNKRYDYLLFSGGGNDLVGKDVFHKWLHDYKPGMTAAKVINNTTLNAALALLEISYRELIKVRDDLSRNTELVFHGYDFAIPDGRQACGLGPWLQPGLEMRKIPKSLRRDVVKEFLRRLDNMLDRLARNNPRITVIQTQGLLEDHQWDNELHPTKGGFSRIADAFVAHLGGTLPVAAQAAARLAVKPKPNPKPKKQATAKKKTGPRRKTPAKKAA